MRLVLRRDRRDPNSVRGVSLDELDEIARERLKRRRQQRAEMLRVAGRLVGLHPGWRAPRLGQDLRSGVDCKRLSQRGDHVRLVMGDREVREARIRLACRQVVIGVRRAVRGEIGCADRHPDEAEVDPVGAEQCVHQKAACGRRELVLDEPRRCIGHRAPKAGDALIANRVVDVDHRNTADPGRREGHVRLLGQVLQKIGSRLHDLHLGIRYWSFSWRARATDRRPGREQRHEAGHGQRGDRHGRHLAGSGRHRI